jgi:hypothetical protein
MYSHLAGKGQECSVACHVKGSPEQQKIILSKRHMAQFLENSALHHASHRLAFCQIIVPHVLLNFCEENNHIPLLTGKGSPMFSDRCLFIPQ